MSDLIFICEICGSVLDESHCKARCPNCGRTLDCSDLPALQADGKADPSKSGIHFIPRPATGLANQRDLEPGKKEASAGKGVSEPDKSAAEPTSTQKNVCPPDGFAE